MSIDPRIEAVTSNIRRRSAETRAAYVERMKQAHREGPNRGHLSCGNQAHAYAAMGKDKDRLAETDAPNLGIVTAYNDMLSSHQPYERFPELIKRAARQAGATAQVAGGVPAMCDGVTQGRAGMELSLFSRDVIALSASVALSHNTYDAVLFLGVCDKIVPGLVIAAATFGHLPAVFVPSGPMTSGLSNKEKAQVRQDFAEGRISRAELMRAEMQSYHGPGTCTFYGTANTNQMLMEFMGLHLPGASFVNPGTEARDALTAAATVAAVKSTALGGSYQPVWQILDEHAFVNGMVGLMATGGSTNLVLHLTAMARAAGIILEADDFAAVSEAVPLLARVYPNGLADVNHFHAAGGLGFMIGELLSGHLLYPDVRTVFREGLRSYTKEPKLRDGAMVWESGNERSENERIVRPVSDPFAATGGLRHLKGNLGQGIMKVSAVNPKHHHIEAPAAVFSDQQAVRQAFDNGDLNRDCIVVVRFQGPRANGMPELHSLTPLLSVLLDRGHKVGLVTDGRMSGASGKVPAAIHISPEAADGGTISKLRNGDMVRLDSVSGQLEVLASDIEQREACEFEAEDSAYGCGRELFGLFRRQVGPTATGACAVV